MFRVDIETDEEVVALAQREVRAMRDVGVVVIDRDYVVRAMDGGLYRSADGVVPGSTITAPAAVGTPLPKLLAELAWQRLKARYDGALAGQVQHFDYVDVSGEHAYDVRITPLLDADDRVCGALAAVQDVSLRWRAERERRHADEFLRRALANMAEGVYAVDERGRLTFLNPAGEALLGYREAELKGQFLHEIIHRQYEDGRPRPRAECPLTEVLVSGGAYRTEDDVFTRKDGQLLPVAYSCSPLPTELDVPGATGGAVVSFRDMTERKRESRKLADDLDALGWLTRVRDALEDERFVVHSQPIVDATNGARVLEELLIRMRDRDGTIIAPGAFLPAAERYGLVYDIDMWMVGMAAGIAAEGRHVAVNISAWTMGRPAALEAIQAAIEHHRCDPRLLCMEITETALINDLHEASRFAVGLRELGCRLALDDFGTGYGSLTHLKNLPVSFIKIDIEFVRDLANNPQSRNVVQALVALAQGGGQKTIAEGVEDEATLELLRELNVDYVQGYLIGRPQALALAHEPAGGPSSS
jgi:PAS domain S-box-containing protein